MNPRAAVLMWWFTLLTLCVLVVAPDAVWIPIVAAGAYTVYAILPSRG